MTILEIFAAIVLDMVVRWVISPVGLLMAIILFLICGPTTFFILLTMSTFEVIGMALDYKRGKYDI